MNSECLICFNFIICQKYYKCNHSYCIDCFIKWNSLNKTCPFCRGNLKYNYLILCVKIILSICYLSIFLYIQ